MSAALALSRTALNGWVVPTVMASAYCCNQRRKSAPPSRFLECASATGMRFHKKIEAEVEKEEERRRRKGMAPLMSSSDLKLLYVRFIHCIETTRDDESIENDLHRTSLVHAEMRPALRNILRTLGVFFPKIGYPQGLNYIAAALISTVDDEYLAFEILFRLMELPFYDLASLFTPGLELFKEFIKKWQASLASFDRELWEHLNEHVGLDVIGAGWFLTIFTRDATQRQAEEILGCFIDQGPAFIIDLASVCLVVVRDLLLGYRAEEVLALVLSSEGSEFMLSVALETEKGVHLIKLFKRRRRAASWDSCAPCRRVRVRRCMSACSLPPRRQTRIQRRTTSTVCS